LPIEKEGFSIIPSFWGAAKELSNWKTCLVKKDEILRWLLLGKGGDSPLSLRMTKKEAQNGWKKKAQMLSWAKRKNDSFFVTLFLPVIFFYLSPFFTCHPEAKPKGLRDSSPSAQNDKKRAQNDKKRAQNDRGRFRKEGILRSLALGSIIKIVSIISGSFFIAYFWAILLKRSYNSLYAIHHLASFTS